MPPKRGVKANGPSELPPFIVNPTGDPSTIPQKSASPLTSPSPSHSFVQVCTQYFFDKSHTVLTSPFLLNFATQLGPKYIVLELRASKSVANLTHYMDTRIPPVDVHICLFIALSGSHWAFSLDGKSNTIHNTLP